MIYELRLHRVITSEWQYMHSNRYRYRHQHRFHTRTPRGQTGTLPWQRTKHVTCLRWLTDASIRQQRLQGWSCDRRAPVEYFSSPSGQRSALKSFAAFLRACAATLTPSQRAGHAARTNTGLAYRFAVGGQRFAGHPFARFASKVSLQ